ncbi:hypothetical protein K0U07_05125 [bacterium]|nr:hypothetical protein [bacterium]
MLFSGRAYYNLLLLQSQRGLKVDAQPWEYMDYAVVAMDDLFAAIQSLHYLFDKESFLSYCVSFDSPEEMVTSLEPKESEEKNKLYLLVFELWKRLLPDRESISIFADALDRRIAEYEKNKDDERILDAFEQVVEILESNCIDETPPESIFERFCLYVAHDLESVIYTYIDSKCEVGVEDRAMDLLDHFLPYVKEKRALQFLQLKSLPLDFVEERLRLTEFLCESLQEEVNLTLSLPFLFYLIEHHQKELFVDLFSTLVHKVNEESALVALLDVLVEYHRFFGREELTKKVADFLKRGVDLLAPSNKNIITALLVQS